jgi:hypothetical protein
MTGSARADGTGDLEATIGLEIDGEAFWVRAGTADHATLTEVARGQVTPATAARAGTMTLDGDRRLATRFFRRFRLSGR